MSDFEAMLLIVTNNARRTACGFEETEPFLISEAADCWVVGNFATVARSKRLGKAALPPKFQELRPAEPTITSTGKRIPGLKLDHLRQLALMHALVRFAHVAADNTFTTAEPAVIKALGCVPDSYTLASLRYDLSKLRAIGLLLPSTRTLDANQLLPQGYSICLCQRVIDDLDTVVQAVGLKAA